MRRVPAADEKPLHRRQRQARVAHQREQFVLDDACLVDIRFADHSLQPDRVTSDALQITRAKKFLSHGAHPNVVV